MAEEQPQPQLLLNLQYVKDLSFEAPNAPAIFTQQDLNPQVNIGVDIEAQRLDGQVFNVILKLEVDAKSGDETVYLVELSYGAVVTLNNIPDQHAEPALLIETPRLIFPFARRVVGDAIRDGGFPPLPLQPIDFMQLYQQRLERMKEANAGGEAEA